jgi:hypothetical protein
MYKKMIFLISFVLVLTLAYTSYGADTTPPTPNPMTWREEPYVLTPTAIAMRATTATDATPPVKYYFECTTDGSKSSSWQSSTLYIPTGLSLATKYTFRVRARDSASTPNMTGWSDPCSATTPISPFFQLDFDDPCDPCSAAVPDGNNFETSTEPNFTGFVLPPSVGRILPQPGYDVNGITIEFDGVLGSRRRDEPNKVSGGKTWHNEIYRDFLYGAIPGGIELTLWGLGDGRKCNITIYAFDVSAVERRAANWSIPDEANVIEVSFNSLNGQKSQWPYYPGPNQSPERYAFAGLVTADKYGRIILNADRDPCSQDSEPFAYVNALIVAPMDTNYVDVEEATIPRPVEGQYDVDVNGILTWTSGAYAANHDLYLDTDFDDVNDANRASHANVEFFVQNVGTNDYNWSKYLKMDQTYYWRIDEVNASGKPQWPGEVWSFTTRKYLVMDNFDYQNDGSKLREVWQEQGTAEIDNKATPVRSGSSMEYAYKNGDYSPYYARAYANVGGPGRVNKGLGMSKDWLSAGAKSISLWFYGQTTNPLDEKMYIDLADGDGNTWTVPYGDMNDVTKKQWQEWNIDLTIAPPYLNLDNMDKITIRFGESGGSKGTNGKVFFDDLRLYPSRCVLSKRSDELVKVDYAPGGEVAGDCVVDYLEIDVMGTDWLRDDLLIRTKNPGEANLVLYYPLDEGDGNKVYPDPSGKLNDPCIWSGTFYNNTLDPPKDTASWASPGYNDVNHCIYMDGRMGNRVQCGRYGKAALGIGPDTKGMTLSIWAKWLGPRYWDPYLLSKGQGLLGKRGGWSESTVIWTFWYNGGTTGDFGLGHFSSGDTKTPDLYSPQNVATPFIGQWVHLAATFPHPSGDVNDANDYARLYLNGANISSGPWRFSHGDDNDIFLTIGQTNDQNAWPDCPSSFYGYLDEVRIYNRALDYNEVAYLADTTPTDGNLWVPIPSAAEIYEREPLGQRFINFRDFAILTDPNIWLRKEYWP